MDAVEGSAESFQHALDEARLAGRSTPAEAEGSRRAALVFSPGLDLSRPRVEGGAARWRLALDWTDEAAAPSQPRPPRPPRPPEDLAASVARELGFEENATRADLTERWRAFVWRNHPDRRPLQARAAANARVAIANALFDEALRRLADRPA